MNHCKTADEEKTDKCQIPRCRSKTSDMEYLGKRVCNKCWDKYADSISTDDFKKLLKIKEQRK